jgi:hypothetical protein
MSEYVERVEPTERDWTTVHVVLILVISTSYEFLFLHHGLNVVDEGWPLYAAMQLHAGGSLYQDVFFVFPPGHLAVAWIAYAFDPPGVVLARSLYASFSVALAVGMYLIGRKIMPPNYALFGTILLAVGATSAHMQQLVFGYRYLVISLLALFAFARWLDHRSPRWIFFAGLLTGLALIFRLTPAFAVGCAIGLGVIAAGGSWRDWLRSWAFYGAGIVIVVGPVIAWFMLGIGPEKLWLETVVRPVAMTDQQSLPMPALTFSPPGHTRRQITDWFVAVQFRAWTLLYAAYALGLAVAWGRAIMARRSFAHVLLLAFVVWGGVYFLRSFGRSDSAHLYSAIPPVCLLIGHAAFRVGSLLPERGRPFVIGAAAAVFLAAWVYGVGAERPLTPRYRGGEPLAVLGNRVSLRKTSPMRAIDLKVATIQRETRPDEVILDLTASSLLYVLSERRGPGYADVIMPGTFLTDAEERAFLARLEQSPPALVIWPGEDFDDDPARGVARSAPRVARWVQQNYARIGRLGRFILLIPQDEHPGRGRTGSEATIAVPG